MRIVSVVRQSGRNSLYTKRKREGEKEEVGWGGVGVGGGEFVLATQVRTQG